jgi:1-aminocyclopropane-1-carboxylate deaminase
MARTIWPSFPNVSIIRGDLAHPIVSGNKLFKALPLVEQAKRCGSKTIISTGGRYSNHLHALSWLAREEDLRSVGLVRGYAGQTPTPTLIDCQRFGMSLHFIDHSTYNSRYSNEFWKPWLTRYQDSFRIDEGGWSDLAIEGTAKWWSYVPPTADMILVAIGSGTT